MQRIVHNVSHVIRRHIKDVFQLYNMNENFVRSETEYSLCGTDIEGEESPTVLWLALF